MYDLEDLVKPYKKIYNVLNDFGEAPTGLCLALGFGFFSFLFCILAWSQYGIITSYQLDYKIFREIVIFITVSLVFYPITFSIIYTPIALLLAIPIVLYKYVFKLG